MKTGKALSSLYEGYYDGQDATLPVKRAIAARQSMAHVSALMPGPFRTVLDVGAGNGSVLEEMDRQGFASELHAVEVSASGLDAIHARRLDSLKSARAFDGYKIDGLDQQYDAATAIHVLEHVEHERAFLRELTRIAKIAYIEVPIEHTFRVERAIEVGRPAGHINFYTPATFRNLLETSGLEVLSFRIFANSREYEVFCSGNRSGALKYALRTGLLRLLPSVAPRVMVYLAGAVCRQR